MTEIKDAENVDLQNDLRNASNTKNEVYGVTHEQLDEHNRNYTRTEHKQAPRGFDSAHPWDDAVSSTEFTPNGEYQCYICNNQYLS